MGDSKINEVGSVINPPPIPIGMAIQVGPPVGIGTLLVADSIPNNRILGVSLLSIMTSVLTTFGHGPGQVSWPIGIAVDPNTRNIFVVDRENHRVQKFSPNFVFMKAWGFEGTGDSQFRGHWGIAIDSNGDNYVIDAGNQRVQKFDIDGKFIKLWGSSGTGDGQFINPEGITFNRLNGNLLVSDVINKNIQIFTTDGVFSGKVQFDIIVHP